MCLYNVKKPNVDNENEEAVMVSLICLTYSLDSLLKAKNLTNDLETT